MDYSHTKNAAKRFLLSCLIAAGGVAFTNAQNTSATESITPATDPVSSNTFFPLMAWDDVENEDVIQKMAECGINSIAFVPPNLLDACEKHNVKAVIYDPSVFDQWDKAYNSKTANPALEKLIKAHNNHPAVYGYHLRDEPDGGQFAELAKSMELVRKLAPGKWPYVNLTPGMGDGYIKDHVQPYIDTCKPPILSFDNYPIGETGTFSYGYWANMKDIRTAALKNNLPFHVIMLSAAHWNYRIPTADDLRLLAYGGLAYGARGLAYYKFRSRSLSIMNAPDLGNFREAPLDQFDEKTQTWHNLQNLNRQVANLAPTLVKLHSDDVYHIGEIPERNHGITSHTLVNSMDSGLGFIIGDFTHEDGSRWTMIVNKDLKNSAFCRPKFNVDVKEVEYISPINGKLQKLPLPWYALAPGQGVLLKLTVAN